MFSVVLFPQAYLRGRCISKSKIAVEVWKIGVCSFRRCKGKHKKIPDYAKKTSRESIRERKKNIGNNRGKNRPIFPDDDTNSRNV